MLNDNLTFDDLLTIARALESYEEGESFDSNLRFARSARTKITNEINRRMEKNIAKSAKR